MISALQTWWNFFRLAFSERMVYRGDFMLGTLMRFLPTLTQIFLWWAIYDVVAANTGLTNGSAGAGSTEMPGGQIAGYGYGDMVAYYLLVTITRAFSSMPGLTSGISRQIRSGEINRFLIQPVDLVSCLLAQRVAHKLVYYTVSLLPFALVFFLCRGFFVDGWPDLLVMCVFVMSLLLSFLLGFFLECSLGLAGFWLLEVTSLGFIYMLFNFFLSGHMFPLELLSGLPGWMVATIDWMPFKYLAWFPAAVFLGKVDQQTMLVGLGVQIAWVAFFIFMTRLMLHRGLKRYSGFGG